LASADTQVRNPIDLFNSIYQISKVVSYTESEVRILSETAWKASQQFHYTFGVIVEEIHIAESLETDCSKVLISWFQKRVTRRRGVKRVCYHEIFLEMFPEARIMGFFWNGERAVYLLGYPNSLWSGLIAEVPVIRRRLLKFDRGAVFGGCDKSGAKCVWWQSLVSLLH
jgi:hypothetical protein